MTVHLVRHAHAGRRSEWSGDDDLRPVSDLGRRQADALVGVLAGAGITRIVSSPFVRCRQSVEPLAQQLRLPVDLSDALAEDASLSDALRLVEKVADEEAVLCTHGDVMRMLLQHLRGIGVAVDPDRAEPRMEKGSTWRLGTRDGEVTTATYVPPPA